MRTVGIKELKAKLSAYINEVRSGKSVFITDHGEEVAPVVPLSNEYRLIRFLETSGRAQWSRGKPLGLDNGYYGKGRTSFRNHTGRKRMIIYLGSSSLIKLYTKEPHSEEVRELGQGGRNCGHMSNCLYGSYVCPRHSFQKRRPFKG